MKPKEPLENPRKTHFQSPCVFNSSISITHEWMDVEAPNQDSNFVLYFIGVEGFCQSEKSGVWRKWGGLWGNRRMGRRRPDRNLLRPSGNWWLDGGWILPFRAWPALNLHKAVVLHQMASSNLLDLNLLRHSYSAIKNSRLSVSTP